ncbi:hypothetical protein ACFL59_12810 [Planctomycetota bacterium]
MRNSTIGALLRLGVAALLLLTLSCPALADVSPDDKDDVPDTGGSSSDVAEQPQKNPLPEIIDLMRQVEDRLAEADAERFTQEEQQRIIDALELGGDAVDELEKLIEYIESRPP